MSALKVSFNFTMKNSSLEKDETMLEAPLSSKLFYSQMLSYVPTIKKKWFVLAQYHVNNTVFLYTNIFPPCHAGKKVEVRNLLHKVTHVRGSLLTTAHYFFCSEYVCSCKVLNDYMVQIFSHFD